MTNRPGAKDFFSQTIFVDNADIFHSSKDTSIDSTNTTYECIDENSLDSLSGTLLDDDASILSGLSLLSTNAFEELSDSCSFDSEDDSTENLNDSSDEDENCTVFSYLTSTTNASNLSDTDTILGDKLPKSFLQLSGISVANFNMRCNFRVEKALSIMIHYDLTILAIQEHTPWNRKLSTAEINSIERHCDKWGYFVSISELQIIIFDKKIRACHRDTKIHNDGRVIECRFEVSKDTFVTFVPVYGIAHFSGDHKQTIDENSEEATKLENMNAVKTRVENIIATATTNKDLIYVFGDLQDTPDQSRNFHFGTCRVPKHPLGIVKTCENKGLICTVYQHLHTLDKPIISRHGTKGGRFLDGMYTSSSGLPNVLGIQIVHDAGVNSDHDLVINKLDFGIKKFQMSREKEERFNFQKIINIPVLKKPGEDHPSLNYSVFKGNEFRLQEQLYNELQSIVSDPEHRFMHRLEDIRSKLEQCELDVIERTKRLITPEDQANGKLIPRTPEDAALINETSAAFFTLLNDICREANLASMVRVLKPPPGAINKRDIASEKIIPGICSIAISRQIDDSIKRNRSILQRLGILINDITAQQRETSLNELRKKATNKLIKSLKRFLRQQKPFLESIAATNLICQQIQEDRRNHIASISRARNKVIFDSHNEYQAFAIDIHGRQEYNTFVQDMKKEILGNSKIKHASEEYAERLPNHIRILNQANEWDKSLLTFSKDSYDQVTSTEIKKWLRATNRAKRKLKKMLHALLAARKEEYENAKMHYIRIGKLGAIAKMTNPKPRAGPTAGSFYPTKPGEPTRRAINDLERKEACILTHEIWMDNPPGAQNCHFLDLEIDAVGPNGVKISPDKEFDENAQWKYLEGYLHEKAGQEISDRVQQAHKRLPELFKHVPSDSKISYPFKYDCTSGKYMCQDLEDNLRKNAAKGNGKARNTGFAIPVLGRLPKAFLNVYLLKCKLQMALRLLDIGTECSLRICIGKPCGGVRPLTVGHDDNVFLNGIAQQAIQKEIARIGMMPETLCSYQKGKGCGDATIIDSVIKEIALQYDKFYFCEIDDDAEKMFDRLHLELQLVLLMLAGAGKQGFTEWQSANMCNRTNTLVTDIFIVLLKYKCGLPQGSGFSVEIANLYAMFLLMWWNMDPIDPYGTIAPFEAPRHGFPLMAGGLSRSIASLAYVDDAKRYIALLKSEHSLNDFYATIQGYCDLLADLSLGIKMGRNVRKCTIYLYNIPEDAVIPEFTSIAWSFEAGGPVKGFIAVVVMRRDSNGNLICYDAPSTLQNSAPQHVKAILHSRKYLGVYNNAQLDNTEGKGKILKKLSQRIGLISSKTQTIQETKIAHNMLVCQVATFSPLCIYMSLKDCSRIDKQLLAAYQYRLKYMPNDSKHNIFLSEKMGGIGVRCFTQEYVGALIRDLEVFISNKNSLPAHALVSSLEEATTKHLWLLHRASKIPAGTEAAAQIAQVTISGKKTLHYVTDWEKPSCTTIAHDHTHIMERAIETTSKLGFMLRDLEYEFCSRFADELLLQDRNAKAIGSPLITSRAKLGAFIGEGNKNFFQYSALGHVYLLLRILFAEIINKVRAADATLSEDQINTAVIQQLSRRDTYDNYKLFPGEISASKLTSTACRTLLKFKIDYKVCSFYNLAEWRSYKDAAQSRFTQRPSPADFKIIINDNNVFIPKVFNTMPQNSESLSEHLASILRLRQTPGDPITSDTQDNCLLSDNEIISLATRHDLPIFVSIDGSLLSDGTASVSVNLIAPDIRHTDQNMEWQHRLAKILLGRSWKLPKLWGTGKTCINMAEALGFIIGEYTIPPELPVIYITDSNNARTLQRNIKNKDSFTHRQMIRQVKQGIDQSIANHLEFLTSQWIPESQLSQRTKELYARGEEICKLWASNKLLPSSSHSQPGSEYQASELDNSSKHSSCSWEKDVLSINSDSETENPPDALRVPTTRYRFGTDMYDLLGRNIVIKVFSHQLNEDFTIKTPGRLPKPNLFIASANQIADNTATIAHQISTGPLNHVTDVSYPAFSSRWCFTFEGRVTNKGATKVLQTKIDEELFLRKQHREKQGLFHRLFYFNGLRADLIGDESLLRNIMKQTAPCWTRCLYRHPPMVKQVYDQWWFEQSSEFKENNPHKKDLDLKNWKKDPITREYIIKRCPFCPPSKRMSDIRSGNLEHMHLYCRNASLIKARNFCNEKIEQAVHALYDFASTRECNLSFENNSRTSTLQATLEQIAVDIEKQEHPVFRNNQIVMEARTVNKAILRRSDIQYSIANQKLPEDKLLEFDQFPLSSRLGFLHALPEQEFDIGSAPITDVAYSGFFPKAILKELHHYARIIRTSNEDDTEFTTLIESLTTAVIYKSIVVQKVIHILLADAKALLRLLEKERTAKNINSAPSCASKSSITSQAASKYQSTLSSIPQLCCATKCRLLVAQGIRKNPMTCTTNRTMCSGCLNENLRQRKLGRLENETLEDTTPNATLEPLLICLQKPTSLKEFRTMMQHLPTMNSQKRDDHIYGAARYFANSLGFAIPDTDINDCMDPPLALPRINEMWRQAKFYCRCHSTTRNPHNIGVRAFCVTCSFLIFYDTSEHNNNQCRGCNINEPWKQSNSPCIACQLATIVYRNPFHKRLAKHLDFWLTTDDSSNDSINEPTSHRTICTSIASKTQNSSSPDLLRLRHQSIERNYQEIKNRGIAEQTKYVFEDLSILQNDIRSQYSNPKRPLSSQPFPNPTSKNTADTSFSSKRTRHDINAKEKNPAHQRLPQRIPLQPIDINSMTTGTVATLTQENSPLQIGNKRRKKQAKTLKMKELKITRQQRDKTMQEDPIRTARAL